MCLRDKPCKPSINLNSKTCIVIANAILFVCGIYSHDHKAGIVWL